MACDESFRHICERKTKDGRQIELIQKLSAACDGAEVRGGFDETIEEFSLSLLEDEQLPFLHYKIVTPNAMKPDTINQRLKETVEEHMGKIEHIFCPDQTFGKGTTTHSFFIVSPRELNYLLDQLVSNEQKAKEVLGMIYVASMEKTKFTKEVTRPARLCMRVQVGAYIQCKASDQDLEANGSWKRLYQSIRKSFCTSVKDETRREAQKILLDIARKISRSNKRRRTGANSQEHISSSSSISTKTRRSLNSEDDGLQQHDAFSCLVQPKIKGDGIDTSEQDDGSPDSTSQQICQEKVILGSPRGSNGLPDEDMLQNSTPGTPLLANNNQDGFLMESYDPFAEADLSMLNNVDTNRFL